MTRRRTVPETQSERLADLHKHIARFYAPLRVDIRYRHGEPMGAERQAAAIERALKKRGFPLRKGEPVDIRWVPVVAAQPQQHAGPAQVAPLRAEAAQKQKDEPRPDEPPRTTVLVDTLICAAVQRLIRTFEQEKGIAATLRDRPGLAVQRAMDQATNVAIATARVIDALIATGKLHRGFRVEIAHAAFALGVPVGAPRPAIETVEQFRAVLLAARSIAHPPAGDAAEDFRSIVRQLGIEREIAGKLRPIAQRKGKQADLVLTPGPLIVPTGMTLAGPIPGELQRYVGFAAAIGAGRGVTWPAKALLRWLADPSAAGTWRACGLEPGAPPRHPQPSASELRGPVVVPKPPPPAPAPARRPPPSFWDWPSEPPALRTWKTV